MSDKRVVFYIEKKLHSQFKSAAAIQAITIRKAATRAINDWLGKSPDEPTQHCPYCKKEIKLIIKKRDE